MTPTWQERAEQAEQDLAEAQAECHDYRQAETVRRHLAKLSTLGTVELRARLRAYADRKGLTVPDATIDLLDAGLRAHERAVQAGKARGATFTTEQGRSAVTVRWTARTDRP